MTARQGATYGGADDAARQAFWARALAALGAQNIALTFELTVQETRPDRRVDEGRQAVPLDRIVGQVGRYQDFSRSFLPKSAAAQDDSAERWQRLSAQLLSPEEEKQPPVELYRVGDVYFVKEGGARIAIARQLGQATIEAHVWAYAVEPEANEDLLATLLAAEHQAFLDWTGLDELRPGHAIRLTVPGGYQDLLEQITATQERLTQSAGAVVAWEEAVVVWYDESYQVVVRLIEARGLARRFADRTPADLYLWTLRHQPDLAAQADPAAQPRQEAPPETGLAGLLKRATHWIATHLLAGTADEQVDQAEEPPSTAPQPGGNEAYPLPKTDRLDRPNRELREATEPERPWPYETPSGGHVREPDRALSKKEAEDRQNDVIVIQDEQLDDTPTQPDSLFEVPPPPIPPAPAEAPEAAAPPAEPEPTREAALDEREESPADAGEDEEAPAEPPALAKPPAAPAPSPIEFAAHYPREIKPGPDEWQPLLAYLYRATAADAVAADAKDRLGPRPDVRVTRRPALSQVQAGALVIATPDVPGLEFNPPSAVVRFVKDWHRFEFEFRATDAPLDEAANGRITFMVEGLIVGDVPLSVYVSQDAASAAPPQVTQAQPYRAIFCSYSHKDTAIVELVELAMRTLGDQYLRDATTLRSGEDWNDALMRMIDAADIFQLFWSENAAGSKFVEEEWRYALSLKASQAKDDHFLRPVRWVDPIAPNPPDVLSRIEFFYEPRLLHWQQIEPGDPQPPVGLHPGGSGTD